MQSMLDQRARLPAIAICGGNEADPDVARLAQDVGQRVVAAGCTLVCGGGGGVMEAAARGGQLARRQGAAGFVLGILPGEQLEACNAHCDVAVATGMGVARNALVVRSADAVILLDGGAGTLSEAAIAWQIGKPIVALVDAGGWAQRLAGTCLDARRAAPILEVHGAEAAVSAALAAIGR